MYTQNYKKIQFPKISPQINPLKFQRQIMQIESETFDLHDLWVSVFESTTGGDLLQEWHV